MAIGHFDGIHKGHKELIKALGEHGALIVVESDKANITPKRRREEYAGVPCFYYHLNDVRELRGDEFIELIKRDFDGLGVHSSAIRRFIADGDIYRANRLLGREYSIEGRVLKGCGIGREKLYPTLNLAIEPYVRPGDGVYATRTKIDDITYNSVTFIGDRATTGTGFAIESHLLDVCLFETPAVVRVCFVERIRDNVKFESLDALKAQIEKDMNIARNVAKVCDLSLKDDYIHARDLF